MATTPNVGVIEVTDCSRGLSDWYPPRLDPDQLVAALNVEFWDAGVCGRRQGSVRVGPVDGALAQRSEERRVGKNFKYRLWPDD